MADNKLKYLSKKMSYALRHNRISMGSSLMTMDTLTLAASLMPSTGSTT
ncbi:MAG: hypothetical protein ACLSH6_03610 [Limosilactobacillus pontis]